MSEEKRKLIHWADMTADRIIRQQGDKDLYVLASGITPSGVVHFGNFRETITVDLVARALRDRNKNVRFIFSWDDYDTFRKIPKNMPKQDILEQYLFQPIVDTPDPFEQTNSYAEFHEKNYEAQLKKVGIDVEAIYQSKKYRNSDYSDQIKLALKNKAQIADILNKHRTTPLNSNWMPVSLYCEKCNRDKMQLVTWDNNDTLKYTCELCQHNGEEIISTSSRIKLPWRIDWPMRWAYESVDFEPGGKDHSSEGGSFSTAKEIVKEIYDAKAPIYLQYDFVSIKGAGGKMSSSSGNVITVNDVLKVYEPEMVRWIFASYKTNVDFSVSFDLDVIKTYEDYDRQERLAFGVDSGNQKKVDMAKRVFELSQISEMPQEIPFQPSFRHLCNILQINNGDLAKTKVTYQEELKSSRDERRLEERSLCAKHWLEHYAPEEFKFGLNQSIPTDLDLTDYQNNFIKKVKLFIQQEWSTINTDKDLHGKLYEFIHEDDHLEPSDAFQALYKILISKEKGPKLAGFIRTIGRDKVLEILS